MCLEVDLVCIDERLCQTFSFLLPFYVSIFVYVSLKALRTEQESESLRKSKIIPPNFFLLFFLCVPLPFWPCNQNTTQDENTRHHTSHRARQGNTALLAFTDLSMTNKVLTHQCRNMQTPVTKCH